MTAFLIGLAIGVAVAFVAFCILAAYSILRDM